MKPKALTLPRISSNGASVRYHIDVQVLNESGDPVVEGTFPRRAAVWEARQGRGKEQLPWRRLTVEYTSPKTAETYLLIYRIPHPSWTPGTAKA